LLKKFGAETDHLKSKVKFDENFPKIHWIVDQVLDEVCGAELSRPLCHLAGQVIHASILRVSRFGTIEPQWLYLSFGERVR